MDKVIERIQIKLLNLRNQYNALRNPKQRYLVHLQILRQEEVLEDALNHVQKPKTERK